ncbi:MAG: GTP-binding protein, partial [Thermoplasmata archaeon]|nr:GTP-binding protein [Thermoplasmata archaeon]
MIVEEANEMRKKFVLLGDEAVGKTSLIRRFVTESFDDKYISTIGTKVTKKNMDMRKDGQLYSIHMMIWDMVGQKNFKLILRSALKGAQGLIMVCDLTRRSTLDSLMEYWFPEVEKCCGKIPMVFLANKSDIVGEAQFELEDLEDVARQHDALFYLTSAKTGENVERTFLALGKASLGSEGK